MEQNSIAGALKWWPKNMCAVPTLFLVLFVLAGINGNDCAKILGVFAFPAHSHFTLGFTLMKELASRGHEVTFINPYPQKTPIKNLKDVPVLEFVEEMNRRKANLFDLEHQSLLTSFIFLEKMGLSLTEYTLENKNVQDLINSNATFDLVIQENFVNEGLMGLAWHFKAPLLLLSPTASSSWSNHMVANPAPISYIPNMWTKFTQRMSFWERVQNAIYELLDVAYREIFTFPNQNTLLKKYFPQAPDLYTLMRNVSLILLTSHVSTNNPVPHVPNMIEIGGYHVEQPQKLPSDLQKFLDDAKDGAIYFSLGSNLKSSSLSPEKRDAILKSFAKLKQRVLWKWEQDVLPGQPHNVLLRKWFPQKDVLAHPNIRAFITHGGLLSTIETIYHGVPIIGIPVFGDQKMNINTAVQKGYALMVPFGELSEEKLTWALNEILNNPKYRENAQSRSKIMHDQPIKPMDSAVYWIEYVIRHKGASHFRSAALDLAWYELHLLDVAAFIGGIVLVVAALALFALYLILRLFRKEDPSLNIKKKN